MAARYPHGAGYPGTAALSREYLDDKWLSKIGDDPSKWARSSHNTFMTALVDYGLPGAIIYIWLCVWGLMAVGKLKTFQWRGLGVESTAPAIACSAGLGVVWVAGQFTDYLGTEVQIWFLAMLAASLVHLRQAWSQKALPTHCRRHLALQLMLGRQCDGDAMRSDRAGIRRRTRTSAHFPRALCRARPNCDPQAVGKCCSLRLLRRGDRQHDGPSCDQPKRDRVKGAAKVAHKWRIETRREDPRLASYCTGRAPGRARSLVFHWRHLEVSAQSALTGRVAKSIVHFDLSSGSRAARPVAPRRTRRGGI